MTVGIMVAEATVPHVSSMALFMLSGAVLACASWQMVRVKVKADSKRGAYAFGVSAMMLSFLMGMFMYAARYERMAGSVHPGAGSFKGIVRSMPQEKRKSWMIRLSDARRYDVVLYVGKDSAHLDAQRNVMHSVQEGDTILAIGRHVRSTASADTLFGGYLRMLLHTGACATAYVRPHDIVVAHCDGNITWRNVSARAVQKRLHELYKDNDITGEAGEVIEAVSIGRKADMSPSLRKMYARAGVSHMLALSGFHVGIIMVLFQWVLLSRFVQKRKAQFINLAALLLLWAFVMVAGASASLVRAALMCSVVIVNTLFGRTCSLLNVCVLAYVVMLCINPMSLYDISFQLSFLAVAGIAIYNTMMRGRSLSLPRWVRFFYDVVSISIVCTVFTAPISAHYFGSVSVICLVSNLAAMLFLYVLMAGTFLWWLTLCWPPLNDVVTSLVTWTASTLNAVVYSLASLPFAAISWHPGRCVTLCSYVLLAVVIYAVGLLLKRRPEMH